MLETSHKHHMSMIFCSGVRCRELTEKEDSIKSSINMAKQTLQELEETVKDAEKTAGALTAEVRVVLASAVTYSL
jgi:hypothetical protein